MTEETNDVIVEDAEQAVVAEAATEPVDDAVDDAVTTDDEATTDDAATDGDADEDSVDGAPRSKKVRETVNTDPTKVARQNRPAAAAPASGSPASPEVMDDDGVKRQVIQRQQPRKNTRADRKQ